MPPKSESSKLKNILEKIIAPALQIQIAPTIGFLISLIVSYFYFFLNDPNIPKERPEFLWLGFNLSALCFIAGSYISWKRVDKPSKINLKEGSLVVVLAWVIACGISTAVFVVAQFPIYGRAADFTLWRQIADGLFESMSGYTTTGASILPNVEIFPRGVLAWRSMTHWLGGMGIAYLAITLIRRFSVTKGNIINAEAETPNLVEFENESEASESGFDFLKIYTLLTLVLFVLLVISGVYFGSKGYEKWYDNVFDAWIHTLGTMGTGGFSNYNSSVGLPITVDGVAMAGGLQNKVSEWIIGIFMMFAGSNLSLWYILVFKFKNWRNVLKNRELQVYLSVVGFLSLVIATSLYFDKSGSNFFDSLRYAFFNVNTVMSTTGFGTADFTKWPPIAQGLLFVCYLLGGMVGSTAGGLKISRFIVLFRLALAEIGGLISGKFNSTFTLDGVKYDLRSASLVVINMVLYYILFLAGGILILATSSVVTYVDGTSAMVDFTSAFTASIATLGNIGPAIAVGAVDAGPNGNYFAYTENAKLIMTLLMFVGRVGILTFVVIFMSNLGQKNIEASIPEIEFEEDKPALRA